jgi:N4-(beta-N-acetylglucosaminyl)-L-asparaginase
MEMIRAGKDTLDAVVAGVAMVEDDPKDIGVGYGGLLNEDGVVDRRQRDARPTKRAGAVASIQRIKNPAGCETCDGTHRSRVVVGPGALRFALAHGFKDQELLTDEARIVWLRWRERMSDDDGWGPGLAAPPDRNKASFTTELQIEPNCLRSLMSSSLPAYRHDQLHGDQRTRRHIRHYDQWPVS